MKLYTSFFANLKNIPENIKPVSIAGFSPKWYNGDRFEALAPDKKLLWKAKQGKISEKEYTKIYLAGINALFTPQSLIKKLTDQYNNSDLVFLCFEKRGVFCHRRILADWIKSGINLKVIEL